MRRTACFVTVLFVTGCASYQGSAHLAWSREVQADPAWQRVGSLPAVRQVGPKDCGAAALSAVFGYWQPSMPAPLQRSSIDAALRTNPDSGLSAGALRDYARQQGFRAFVFHGELRDLRHEVAAGRPVIVGVLKELSSREMLSHYLVVIGFHLQEARVLLFDPARGLVEDASDGFLAEWTRAGRLTLVIAPSPGRSLHPDAEDSVVSGSGSSLPPVGAAATPRDERAWPDDGRTLRRELARDPLVARSR